MNTKKFDTKTLVELALLVAITIIMGTTPYGTIRTPLLTMSLVTIPVAIAGIIIGPLGGLICGATFGATSFMNALTGASGMLSTLFTINPFGVFVTAVVARMLEGVCCALIFKALHKVQSKGFKPISYYLAALSCPLLNTLFFMSCLVLFFYNSEYIQNMASNFGTTNPFSFIIACVGVQALIEAVGVCILGGTIATVLAKALHRY